MNMENMTAPQKWSESVLIVTWGPGAVWVINPTSYMSEIHVPYLSMSMICYII